MLKHISVTFAGGLQKSMTLESTAQNSKYVWLTDMACLSNSNCIAVASADYEISFYSMTSNLIQKKFQIKGTCDE